MRNNDLKFFFEGDMHSTCLNVDVRLCNFIALNLFFVFITNLFFILEPWTHVPYTFFSYGTKIVVALYFMYLLPVLQKMIRLDLYFFVAGLLVFFCINYAMFPDLNVYQRNTFVEFFLLSLPSFLVAGCIVDYKLLLLKLVRFSWIMSAIAIVLVLGYFLGFFNVYAAGHYYMGFGYSMLIPACTCVVDFIFYKRRIDILCFLIYCFVILMLGSRGPFISIVCFLAFVCVFVMKDFICCQKKISFWDVTGKSLVLFLLVFLVMLFINKLTDLLINSRTLSLFLSSDIETHSSGRDSIQNVLWSVFFDDFTVIRGLNSEYLFVNAYAHNIILELLFQFGVIVGGAIIVFIALRCFKTMFYFEGNEQSYLVAMYMFCALCSLMVSGSLWNQPFFWVWMSMTFGLKNKKTRKDLCL